MTSEQLYTKFVPIIFKYITGSVSDHVTGSADLINFLHCIAFQCVLPVKHAAIRTLCLFIRHIRRQEQRQELCTKIIEGTCVHVCNKVSNVAVLSIAM